MGIVAALAESLGRLDVRAVAIGKQLSGIQDRLASLQTIDPIEKRINKQLASIGDSLSSIAKTLTVIAEQLEKRNGKK